MIFPKVCPSWGSDERTQAHALPETSDDDWYFYTSYSPYYNYLNSKFKICVRPGTGGVPSGAGGGAGADSDQPLAGAAHRGGQRGDDGLQGRARSAHGGAASRHPPDQGRRMGARLPRAGDSPDDSQFGLGGILLDNRSTYCMALPHMHEVVLCFCINARIGGGDDQSLLSPGLLL